MIFQLFADMGRVYDSFPLCVCVCVSLSLALSQVVAGDTGTHARATHWQAIPFSLSLSLSLLSITPCLVLFLYCSPLMLPPRRFVQFSRASLIHCISSHLRCFFNSILSPITQATQPLSPLFLSNAHEPPPTKSLFGSTGTETVIRQNLLDPLCRKKNFDFRTSNSHAVNAIFTLR